MSKVEKRVRDAINPFSTAFTRWWCHNGRYLLPGPMFRGRTRHLNAAGRAAERQRRHVSAAAMAARRAELDALLASTPEDRPDSCRGVHRSPVTRRWRWPRG